MNHVQRMMRGLSMPRTSASAGLSATARIARPIGIFVSRMYIATIAAVDTPTVIICSLFMRMSREAKRPRKLDREAARGVAVSETREILEHEAQAERCDHQRDAAALTQRPERELVDSDADAAEHDRDDAGRREQRPAELRVQRKRHVGRARSSSRRRRSSET